MGRSSRRKRDRKQAEALPDPERAARIAAQRAKEAEERSNLDSLLKRGSEITAHLHYDKLGKELTAAIEPIVTKLAAVLKESPDRIGDCIVKNNALDRECRDLRARIAGKDAPTQSAAVEKVLALLPKAQADALRFIMAREATAPPESSDTVRATFARAEATLSEMTQLLKDFMTFNTSGHELADEKVQRGWVEASHIEPFKGRLTEGVARIHAWTLGYNDVLTSLREKGLELLQLRAELRRHLGLPAI